MREVDAQRVLRDASPVASVNNVLRQYQRHARDLIGVDQLQRTIQGSMVHAIDDARIAEMSSTIAYASLTRVRDTLRASHVLDESVRRVLPGLRRNLADLSYYALTQSDVLKQARDARIY
jgi:hypothetical protein